MALNACTQNCTDTDGFLYEMMTMEAWTPWNAASDYFEYNPWLFSLLGSSMVGLAGVLPLFVISIDEGANLKNGANAGTLKMLLSFAVGGLLGDIFLHLLPESWANDRLKTESVAQPSIPSGLWVLSGFLVFIIVEKIFSFENEADGQPETETKTDSKSDVNSEQKNLSCNFREKQLQDLAVGANSLKHDTDKEMENNNCITIIAKNGYCKSEFSKDIIEDQLESKKVKNGFVSTTNGYKKHGTNGFITNRSTLNGKIEQNGFLNTKVSSTIKDCSSKDDNSTEKLTRIPNDIDKSKTTGRVKEKSKHITGYLNLMANIIDNFTHGLAVGGSFLVSFRLGALTTFAILIHEIPHEVGDFAILLRSGFTRWDAARAQLLTASGGIIGALAAVAFSGGSVEARTSWILPFTAGGFLHIGMVTILPELLKESSPKESLKQLAVLMFGIILMAVLTILCD